MTDITALKGRIRRQAIANRQAQTNRDALSRDILSRVTALPEYQAAQTIMYYVAMPVEVQTRDALVAALRSDKNVVVPYCDRGELSLFRLESMDELDPGMWTILEPHGQLRSLPAKRARVSELDVIIVPGLAFDRKGGRIGHGKGYYDRLLARAESKTKRIAVAYECQMFPEVPMSEHDIYMDKVVTEKAIHAP
jgi:5-formyltetrahydrofolate cyclo-ligase